MAAQQYPGARLVRNLANGLGGGIWNGGNLFVVNSTVANNRARNRGAGVGNSGGSVSLLNSTVVGNHVDGGDPSFEDSEGGGLSNSAGTIDLANTILALNTIGPGRDPKGPDCVGSIPSSRNNLIGDLSGCNIVLQPGDLIGDAGLGALIDDGAPGHGRFPLLETSQAIDNGYCLDWPFGITNMLRSDQLSTPRPLAACDIGAVEFYPVINDLLAAVTVSTVFDPTPVNELVIRGNVSTVSDPTAVPGGPAGTFRITAEFTNTSDRAIGNRFAEVIELSGGNLLLNADGGAGGVGARVTSPDSASNPFLRGATETFEFVIGLEKQESFTFLVNMLGEPVTPTPAVTIR